ncbi:MAG: 1-deoxy-D-xylulose-5-phosphate synthase [Bacteroidales bacterium]|nr:1-deoxy-D-xylulose-5-phosphate synthase [Bacteroidales bacterium]
MLENINTPQNLRALPLEQLTPLADELRHFIVSTLATHPGHLASSLGTVELTLALHYVFNTPDDRLIWDVGHQSYAHKIITGRRDAFDTIRTYGGISGFPKRSESPYDAFGTGHSSTSISAALGMATASKLQGNTTRQHIAVIGDGALTGGEAFEALNNAGTSKANMLVVLNDNGISIDKAVGGLDGYLTEITASKHYNRLKDEVWNRLGGNRQGARSHSRSRSFFQKLTFTAKTALLGGSNLFESLGIRYFGPIDGHDLPHLVAMLEKLRQLPGPKLLHVITVKGKGMPTAEQDPVVYHAPGLYNADTGRQINNGKPAQTIKYQEVFGRTIVELAEANQAIVGITPAMPTGCSLNIMMEAMPDRAFDVGIAEQHAVTFAAGLAAQGMVPFCNIYSSFAQRAYDQIIHDVALQRLPVVMCLDRAGIVGEDGPTHHGAFDIAALRPIPNLTIAAPMNEHELRNMMYTAQLPDGGAWVIRYPRGNGVLGQWHNQFETLEVGRGRCVRPGTDMAVLALGHSGNDALAAAEQLQQQGLSVAVYDMRFAKPIDTQLLDQVAALPYQRIVTVEDGVLCGGFGTAVLEYMAQSHPESVHRIVRLGLPDDFVTHGPVATLKRDCKIDSAAIAAALTR